MTSNGKIQYEIKLFLVPRKVLNANRELQPDSLVGIAFSEHKQWKIHFLETPDRELLNTGWILRNRIKKADKAELTFKKRFPIRQDDLNLTLAEVRREGFDLEDPNLKLEVDWGYAAKTLSLSYGVDITRPDAASLSSDEWKMLFVNEAPDAFLHWQQGLGRKTIDKTIALGPIEAKKYKAEWEGTEVVIEVWSIGEESVVEISFDTTDESIAALRHDQLAAFLKTNGLLIEQDFSKTRWAIDKLLPVPAAF
ncbi:hypothetical protein ACJ7K1_12960 [Paenibacillus elgii]